MGRSGGYGGLPFSHNDCEAPPRFLVLSLDNGLCRRLASALQDPGYRLRQVMGWRELRALTRPEGPELVILDGMHPDCRNCLLAARGMGRRVPLLLLDAGERVQPAPLPRWVAEARLERTFVRGQLRAMVFDLIGRTRDREGLRCYEADGFRLDFEGGEYTRYGAPLLLTSGEIRLLRLLVQYRGITLAPQFLMDRVWKKPVDRNTLAVAVRRLRSLLEEDPTNPVHLITVYGGGYMWVEHSPLAQSGGVGYNEMSLPERGRKKDVH